MVLLAGEVLGTSAASASTFGGDLSNAPNVSTTCGEGVFPYFSAPMGSPSCMYFSGSPTSSPYAPTSGTVTAVHVRVGAVTGPMQVVVMRSLYQNKVGTPGEPYFACCFVERYGPIFTPQPNSVETVKADLPMTEEPIPPADDFTTNAAGDFLALSVLAPNVPIPAFRDEKSSYSGYYPAPSEGSSPAPGPTPLTAATDGVGAEVLLSADLESEGAPAGKTPASAGPVPAPANTPPAQANPQRLFPTLTFPKSVVPVRNGTVSLPLQCAAADCVGNVLLQNLEQQGATIAKTNTSKKKRKKITYGTGSVNVKVGLTGSVKVKLTAAGRKTAKAHRKLVVWANFTLGSTKLSKRITLTG